MKTVETPTFPRRVASKGNSYPCALAVVLAVAALCSSTAKAQITTLDPSWRVTPDTAKPGFKWNYYSNNGNTENSTARAEAALAGLLKDGTGALLPNLGDPNNFGAAIAAAATANPTNGLLYFEIATTINLNKTAGAGAGNFPNDELEPGLNDLESTDGQAAEILTYITLPVGTFIMGVSSDDGFQTSSGKNPSDAFSKVVVGEYIGGRGAGVPGTLFTNIVTAAGTYPFRTVWENGGGDSNIEWFTVDYSSDTNGVFKLINDVANGGFAAYRAAAGASLPFVKTVTPAPVPRQGAIVTKSVSVVLQDGTSAVDTNSIKLYIDGNLTTTTVGRVGNAVSVNSVALAGLRTAGESHTAVLTFKDVPGTYASTNQWAFANIENLILPASPVTGENFDSYPEATSAATTVPPGWTASNFTYLETPGWDITDRTSDAYLNWVLITTNTVAGQEPEVLQNDQTQTINGIPLTNGWMSGNLIFVASDGRLRNIANPNPELPPASQTISVGQIQIVVSAPFNLSTVTNPVLTFSSGVRISGNGEQMSAEYSINGGTSWLPVIYMRNSESLRYLPNGSYDAVKMFTESDTNRLPQYPTPGVGPLGGNFGSIIAAPISQALAPYIVNRNDEVAARRVEAIRLPQASKQGNVRLRLTHFGSCGWEWGIDNIAFYDIAPSSPLPVITSTTVTGGLVTVKWTNGGVLESSPSLVNPVWTSTGNMLGTYTEATTSGAKFYRVKQ